MNPTISRSPSTHASGHPCARALLAIASLLPLCACTANGDPAPSNTGTGGGGGGGGGGGTEPLPKFTTPPNHLADDERSSLAPRTSHGEFLTITKTTALMFHVTVSGAGQSGVMLSSQADNFRQFRSYRDIAGFDRQFGYRSFTLTPGKYLVGIRNVGNAPIATRYELDLRTVLQPEKGYKFKYAGRPLIDIKNVTKTLVVPFTIDGQHRFFMDGCTNGCASYIIEESQIPRFQSGQEFQYKAGYGGRSNNLPGFWELRLPPGKYYLAIRNLNASPRQAVFYLEKWSVLRQ